MASSFQIDNRSSAASSERVQAKWDPYDSNGGTCVALAGEDYCIVATTTRLSTGLSVLSRDAPIIAKMSDRCMVLASGFQADIKTILKEIQTRNVMYQHQHRRPMSCPALAQLVSNTLYYRRFFPYYSATMVAGLTPAGKGVVYGYDIIGSMQELGVNCCGSGEGLVQPLLDNQLGTQNRLCIPPKSLKRLSQEDAVDVIKDTFTAAGERDIYTGDAVEIYIMTADGIRSERMELKKD